MHGEKEKRQINTTLVRSRATQRPSVTDLCWPIVYRTSDGGPEASQMEFFTTMCTASQPDTSQSKAGDHFHPRSRFITPLFYFLPAST